jgi:hypothetical protein
MGFDLCGVKPNTEKGRYFCNNMCFWRPLWEFMYTTCSGILDEEDARMGRFDDRKRGYQEIK